MTMAELADHLDACAAGFEAEARVEGREYGTHMYMNGQAQALRYAASQLRTALLN